MDNIKKALQKYLESESKTEQALKVVEDFKDAADPTKLAENKGFFAPMVGSGDSYKVVKLTTNNYVALKKIYMQSSNVGKKSKSQIAEEMGWEVSSFIDEYSFLDHYYAICELIFEGFESKEADLDMEVIDNAVSFFLFR